MVSGKPACVQNILESLESQLCLLILLHFTLVTACILTTCTALAQRVGCRHRYNVTDSVRDALETLVKHASNQDKRIRYDSCIFIATTPTQPHDQLSYIATHIPRPCVLMRNVLCRHLEDALNKKESVSARSQEKFENRIDKVEEEMESVRACAVSPAADLARVPRMIAILHSATAAYSIIIY